MCIPVRCQTCGKCIGRKKLIMAIIKLRSSQKKEFNYAKDLDCTIKAIFRKFKIRKYCCRTVLTAYTNVDEMLKR